MQLREAVQLAAARLGASPHPERARRDAEMLLLHLTGKSRAWLLAHGDEDFGGCTAVRYASLVERRLAGEPIQYITGEVEFYRLPFRVTREVLIPRPETELLVEHAVQLIPTFDRRPKKFFEVRRVRPAFDKNERKPREGDSQKDTWPPRILDVGTGSGCIAISIAHDWEEAEITAIDASASALEVACFNAENLGFADCIRFLHGDLLTPVDGETFDLVVSNPPYVSSSERDSLSVEVREYEPAMALFAGNDGLDVYRRLIPQAFSRLGPGGHILLEIGYGQADAVRALLEQSGFFNVRFVPDLRGIPRVVGAMRGKD